MSNFSNSSPRIRRLRRKTRKYLKSRNALEKGMAIQMTESDWKEIGWPSDPTNNAISKALSGTVFETMEGIKRTEDGRFWYDEKNYKKFLKIGFIIFAILFVGTFCLIISIPFVAVYFGS